MLIEVVQLRVTGMKLLPNEIAEAPRHQGNLTMTKDGVAYLHLGDRHQLGHVLNPMVGVKLVTMRGDDFMLVGLQYLAYGKATDMHPQAWWCKALRGDHLPAVPLFTGRPDYFPPESAA